MRKRGRSNPSNLLGRSKNTASLIAVGEVKGAGTHRKHISLVGNEIRIESSHRSRSISHFDRNDVGQYGREEATADIGQEPIRPWPKLCIKAAAQYRCIDIDPLYLHRPIIQHL